MGNKINRDKDFFSALFAMDCYRGKSYANIFDEFLDLALLPFCNNGGESQLKLWNDMMNSDERRSAFFDAFDAYGKAAEDYHDPLGDFFMEYISHGHNGQFFTPEDMCKLMSDIVDSDFETINDPCCGSGRTLLAGVVKARSKGIEPFVYANDLSYTCARMTLLNFLVNGIRGEVSCGDTLLLDYDNFIFFKIDRVMMPDGKWLSTYWSYRKKDIEEVNAKRNKWIIDTLSQGLWVEQSRPSDKKAVEPATNVVGQLSLAL